MIRAQRCHLRALLALLAILPAGCKAPAGEPSNGVGLPIPPGLHGQGRLFATATRPAESKHFSAEQKRIDLSPIKVIHLTFDLSPQIRAAYLRYAGEKARYDYIIATWTSTTPGASIGPGWHRGLDVTDTITNNQTQRVEAFVERNFLDTSRLRAFAGGVNEDASDTHAFHPTAGGLLRFPLWGSREALQRSSEQIFQQTRVNDAQLEYVRQVRQQLRDTTTTFFAVLSIGQRVEARQQQIDDLRGIQQRAGISGKPPADLQRLQAELVSASTELRSQQSNYAVEMAWMISTMGLPRDLDVRLLEGPFNPFDDTAPEQLLAMSMRADPEIATLTNAIKDSQVLLALARKGRLDVAMNLGAAADFRGSGEWAGQTQYQATALLSVGFIDQRLSTSLAREASANIWQYENAIQRRRNEVYVDATEPLIRIRALTKSIPDRQRNVERYQRDFDAAVQDYFVGRMDIDDLIRRRQDMLDEEFQLTYGKSDLGGMMVSLAAATGKFFELLAEPPANRTQPTQPASQPALALTSQSMIPVEQETQP